MKVAVVGKGGVGKTTTAAILARSLARRGHDVVALDCDTNANLGLSLGLGEAVTEHLVAIRQGLDDGESSHALDWAETVARFGTEGPDQVRLAVAHRIEQPDPGCP